MTPANPEAVIGRRELEGCGVVEVSADYRWRCPAIGGAWSPACFASIADAYQAARFAADGVL